MKAIIRMCVAGMLVAVLPFAAAGAETRSFALAAGETATWEGVQSPGINTNYHGNHDTDVPEIDNEVRKVQPTYTCTADPQTFCDVTLVSLSNPVPEDDPDGKLATNATFKLTNALGDVDLRLYESDAEGTKGEFIAMSAGPNPLADHNDLDETVVHRVTTTRPTAANPTQAEVSTKWILVEVVYYTAAGYTGTVTF